MSGPRRARAALTFITLAALTAIGGAGCGDAAPGDEAADVAACDAGALIAQCPPGSQPLIGVAAEAACAQASSLDGDLITEPGGAVSGVCRSEGSCVVACNFEDPCACGVERITDEGVFCASCQSAAACGDGRCDGGETADACPLDCGAACVVDASRCAGDDREVCNERGAWERVPCRDDQSCTELPALGAPRAYCEVHLSPAGGSYPGPDPAVTSPGDAARLRLRQGTLPAEALAFMSASEVVMRGATLRAHDLDADVSRTLVAALPPGDAAFDLRAGLLAVAARRPTIQGLDSLQATTLEGFVDDVTQVTPGVVRLSEDGASLATSFSVEGQPLVAVHDVAAGSITRLLRFVDPDVSRSALASALAFNADATLLAEGRDGVVIIWSVAEGRYVHLLGVGVGAAARLAFLPGAPGRLLITGPGRLELWRIDASPGRLWGLDVADAHLSAVSPDGQVAVVGSATLRFIDLEAGALIDTLSVQAGLRASPLIAPDASRLIVGPIIYGPLN